MTKTGLKKFDHWIKNHGWTEIFEHTDPNKKAALLVKELDNAMDQFFPKKRNVMKSTDDPWITPYIKRRIRSRKEIFGKERRSAKWKAYKKRTNYLINESKKDFYLQFLNESKTNNNPSVYYKIISRLKDPGAKQQFSVMDLYKNEDEQTVAEKAADYFTRISNEFNPLTNKDISDVSKHLNVIKITEQQVEDRIRACKKPKGLLSGDLYPKLLMDYAKILAKPLTDVLNEAFLNEVWPKVWREETVTIIPKCQDPEDLGSTRNISCTPVFSKIMEFFLLERLKEEAKPKSNPFGGISGSGTSHYLVETWTDIMEALDQDGGALQITIMLL